MDLKNVLEGVKQGYPSLKNTKINLVFKRVQGGKVRWPPGAGYQIILNPGKANKLKKKELVGLIAHELAHVYQIKNEIKGFMGRIFWRIKIEIQEMLPHKYVKRSFRNIERSADKIAIEKGFGNELFAIRSLSYKMLSEQKINKMEDIYMSPEEIKERIKQKKCLK